MIKYDHVIWDVDGTLIDTEEAIIRSLQITLREMYGKEKKKEELDFVVGMTSVDAMNRMEIPQEEQEQMLRSWCDHLEEFRDTIRPYPGIETTLRKLKESCSVLGIITARTRAEVNKDMVLQKLLPNFSMIICSDDTENHKPDPEPLFYYMQKQNTEPDRVLYIGDSIYDMKCAKQAGVDSVLALWGCKYPQGLDRTYEAADPLQILNLVGCSETKKQGQARMVILGGGYVSLALSKMAKILGFHITVMDDREEFANRERFSHADCVICESFEWLKDLVPEKDDTSYVIVTRGHQADQICLEQLMQRQTAYLGMIGSKKKVAASLEKLREKGIQEDQIAQIHAPIGLDIGSETPEEIAVSILAEIIQVRHKKGKDAMDPEMEKAKKENVKGVLMTIREKNGSAPRGVGSRMVLSEDGKTYGSIGGGKMEQQALEDARKFPEIREKVYDMTSEEAGELGMICGGKIRVTFETFGD